MTRKASGAFDVKVLPRPPDDDLADTGIGRMGLDKRFHGDLSATSKGAMLAFRSSTPGSAGYVAMETVVGALLGRTGTFVLQHSGTMTRGTQTLALTVVPDSATGQLVGLWGRMAIIIAEGKHSYEFEFDLPESTASRGE